MDDFLTIHIDIVSLLELEIERKTKKKIEGRKQDRENEEKITNINTNLYRFASCNSNVIFLLMKKKSARKNNFISLSTIK